MPRFHRADNGTIGDPPGNETPVWSQDYFVGAVGMVDDFHVSRPFEIGAELVARAIAVVFNRIVDCSDLLANVRMVVFDLIVNIPKFARPVLFTG
jgi:hypothetical protein